MTETFRFDKPHWNGIPCEAQHVTIIVADNGEFPQYWARDLVGQERDAIRVRIGPQYGQDEYGRTNIEDEFFLDNQEGQAYTKLMNGGGPSYGHRTLIAERVVREGVRLA